MTMFSTTDEALALLGQQFPHIEITFTNNRYTAACGYEDAVRVWGDGISPSAAVMAAARRWTVILWGDEKPA